MTTRNEDEIMKAIDEATRDVVVPEPLRPEAVEKLLERAQAQEGEGAHVAVASGRRVPSGWRKRALPWGIAACLVLVVGVGLFAGRALLFPSSSANNGGNSLLQPLGTGGLEPAIEPDAPVGAGIVAAESYDQVKQCFDEYEAEQGAGGGADGGVMLLESAPSAGADDKAAGSAQDATASSNAAPAAASGSDHSDTNVRTEGVDEADIVKTDGEHLFILQDSATEIAVVDATGDDMKKLGSIRSGNQGQISEFYVRDGKAFVLSNVSIASTDNDGNEAYGGTEVQLETFDIADVRNPNLVGTVTQSGWYQSSRIADGYLYLFSTYYVPYGSEGDGIEPYIPRVAGQMVACQDIYLPPLAGASQYLVITSIAVDDPTQTVDQKAVLTDSNSLYVSAENIYVYENKWRVGVARDGGGSDQGRITIRKIAYHDGRLEGVAQTKVDGTLNDSFSIDEHEGMLRLVTTVSAWDAEAKQSTSTNEVHVLDENLEEVGSITGLAEDERVYSARFFGDTAYFVTFRETDPLFTVDFSDPTNPQIIGSLKIPGFSEYLHPYGEGKLLGIGMDVDEKSGVTNGMKVTMFDVSDPTDVKEADTFLIEDPYGSDVFHDYRAVLISADRNMIGFSGYAGRETYYVFDYVDGEGFEQLMAEDVNGGGWTGTRGVYIDDTLYVVKGNAVESYRIGSYEKVDDLLL